MILTGISISLAFSLSGAFGIVLALFLSQLQMLFDCVDGEIARWREKFAPAGIFLDKVGHYFAESLIPIAIGLRLMGESDDYFLPFLGALLATLIVINKGLNDAVHVARAFSGLERLADRKSTINRSIVSRLRSLANALPIHRAYHSVEMTLIFSLAYLFDWLEEALLVLVVASPFVTVGHIIAILSSNRLKKSL
jgi:phosphatidylglycerophosphate synthase